MIRATLDTNVLVSALEFGGTPGQILNMHTDDAFVLCMSSSIISELRRVLTEYFDWSEEDLDATVGEIVQRAEVVEPTHAVAVSRDPDDNHILSCAVEANVDVLVTGDNDLLVLGSFQGIQIKTPRQFLDHLLTDR